MGGPLRQPRQFSSQIDVTARLDVANRMVKGAYSYKSPHLSILDLGCGTGEGISRIYAEGMTVIATDLSLGMVRNACRRFSVLRGCVGDAANLPFGSETFDIVQSLGVLEYVGPYECAVRELRRVLKPGGTLVLSVPNRHSLFRRLHRLERLITGPLRQLRNQWRGDTKEENDFYHRQWTLTEAVNLFENSGFLVLDVNFITYGVLLPVAEKWRVNISLCKWLNSHCHGGGFIARNLACTTVLQILAV